MFHHSSILFICTPLWAWHKDQEVLPSRFHLKQNLQWTNMAWCIWYYLIQLIPPVSWHQHVSPWRAAGPGRGHGVHRGNRPGWKQHGGVNSFLLRALGVFYVGLTPGIIGSIWINMETLVGCSFPRSSDQFNKGPVLVHCLFNLLMFWVFSKWSASANPSRDTTTARPIVQWLHRYKY